MLSGDVSVADLTSVRANADLAGSCVIVMRKHPILRRMVRGLKLSRACDSLGGGIALGGPSGSQVLRVAIHSTGPSVTGGVTSRVTHIDITFVRRGVSRSTPGVVRGKCSSKRPIDPGVVGGATIKKVLNVFLTVTIVIITCLFGSAVVGTSSMREGLKLGILNALPLRRTRCSKRGRHGHGEEGGGG